MRTWVKFCGCTSFDDARLAAQCGADAFGMIFAPSPRRIARHAAEEIAARIGELAIEPVAVLVDPEAGEIAAVRALFPTAWLQFSGSETPATLDGAGPRCIKAIHVGDADTAHSLEARSQRFARARLLFDTHSNELAGGTGERFVWERTAAIARRRDVVVAGGLTAQNVGSCVESVHPFGVDVRSGIETAGRKDAAKMRAFVGAVRGVSCAR